MDIFLRKKDWLDFFHGWRITDCAVRSSDIIYLIARKIIPEEEVSGTWDEEIPSQFIGLYLDEDPEDLLDVEECVGFNRPRCGISHQPLAQGLFVDNQGDDGTVWAIGSQRSGMEKIAPGNFPMTVRLKCINGYAYSVGRARCIYKRTNIGHWVKLDNGFPATETGLSDSEHIDIGFAQGFYDMDGFSETDMYAVGGHGDIWHYDGTIWTQEGFPSNMQLNTVTCAGDGYVYVSGQGGILWRGRNSTWEKLYGGGYTIPWNDVLWFEDKLWLASDYMLRIWDGKELVPVTDAKGQELPFSGHMDAYDDLLVIADTDTVMAYQHGKWRTLVAPYE